MRLSFSSSVHSSIHTSANAISRLLLSSLDLLYYTQYLLDISECVFLARPLVRFCCQRFSTLYDQQQRLSAFVVKKPHMTPQESMEVDDDEVFSSGASAAVAGSRKAGRSESLTRKPAAEDPKVRVTAGEEENRSHRKRAHLGSVAGGGNPTNQSTNEPKGSCSHHQSLLGQLGSIIQVLALQCPTAFIMVNIVNKGVGRDTLPRASTALDKLPLPLPELPATKRIQDEEQRKVCPCVCGEDLSSTTSAS